MSIKTTGERYEDQPKLDIKNSRQNERYNESVKNDIRESPDKTKATMEPTVNIVFCLSLSFGIEYIDLLRGINLLYHNSL